MSNAREILTPEALVLLQSVARAGSFAAAARALGLVPSAVTYRVRQIEDALDALLFDRSSRQARLTAAGTELLREGELLLRLLEVDDVDPVALAEDARLVARVPQGSVGAEVDAGFEEVFGGGDGHGGSFCLARPTSARRNGVRQRAGWDSPPRQRAPEGCREGPKR